MTVIKLILIAVISYLLGSLNFGVILSKFVKKDDVREKGSGNAGTTNMMRSYGKIFGILTIIGDIAKVIIAIEIAFRILPADELKKIFDLLNTNPQICLKSFAGLFAVIGHIFPCFFGFKGGKGVATSGGMVIFVNWKIALILFTVFVINFFTTKYVSLGSIIMAVLYPIMMWFFYKDLLLVVISCIFTLIVIIAHRENIKKLINGTENKISFDKKNTSV